MLTLLVPAFPVVNPNLDVLRPALRRAGIAFEERAFDALRLEGRTVCAPDEHGDYAALDGDRLVWVLGFGRRANLLDRIQLLDLVPARCRFVTTPRQLLHAHAKYGLVAIDAPLRHPETHASNDARWLWRIVERGGEWIAKPPGASFGRGVFRLTASDRNGPALLEMLTGHGAGDYALLQRYVPDIDRGEMRVLVAFGEVIGAYARQPNASGITNLAAGATAVRARLDEDALAAMTAYATALQAAGIGYAGVDLAYPWLIETNVANPGGLATLVSLGDTDAPDRLAVALARSSAR